MKKTKLTAGYVLAGTGKTLSIELPEFKSKAAKARYDKAWKKYLEEKAKY